MLTIRQIARSLARSSFLGLAPLLGPSLAGAQTFDFMEDFEDVGPTPNGQQGPQNLAAQGWLFRNQSNPVVGAAWLDGGAPGWPNTGAGFLASSSSATGLFGGQLSNWAILPPIAGQAAGDVLSIWVLGGGSTAADTFLDVRYSPTGGTSTGTGPFAVGDFTQVLFSEELNLPGPLIYVQVQVALPGPGRLALRFHAPSISNFAGGGATVWFDTLTLGDPPADPCGLELPDPGQTVTWDAAGSPYTVCQDLVVPRMATLELAAGAVVQFDHGRDLIVEGTLRALGTPAAKVVLSGDHVSGLRVSGQVQLEFADVDVGLALRSDSTFEAVDSLFRHEAWFTPGRSGSFMRLERCELASERVELAGSYVLEDVLFSDPMSQIDLRGFWNIRALESFAPVAFTATMQDRRIDRVTVTGASAPALVLQSLEGAVDYHLGAGNALAGNQYPVWTRSAGVTADSALPLAGNQNDAVLGIDVASSVLRSRVTLPDLGLPYHFLERGTAAGDVRVAPGARLLFGPRGGLTLRGDKGADANLRGLPGQPIRLERLLPNQQWLSLTSLVGWSVLEHLAIDGAGIGVVGNSFATFLRDTTISGCALGAQPADEGLIVGSGVRFLQNQVGLRNDTSFLQAAIGTGIRFSGLDRPSVFEGNLLAADNVPTTNGTLLPFPVDRCWWGHPTGPFEPQSHPTGQGDEVSTGVDFQPFLTAEPDLGDARPVVRLKTALHPIVLPGERIFLEWEASDDGVIERFDLQVSNPDPAAPWDSFVDLVPGMPGAQRRCELVVPQVGLQPKERFAFRLSARDDAGNVGFEQFWLVIPHQVPAAQVSFQTVLDEFRGGEDVAICYDATGLSSSFPEIYIETASDDRLALGPAAPPGVGQCTLSDLRIPFASTDRARLALRAEGNLNRDEWYFSDSFTIRPDARIGDAPPVVRMLAPLDGESFAGGALLPIRWTASDDLGLREFRLQASFNGGYTFHTIASSLPPGTTSYKWRLPASAGLDDLRLRVVAVDTSMQNSADGDERVLRVTPGLGGRR